MHLTHMFSIIIIIIIIIIIRLCGIRDKKNPYTEQYRHNNNCPYNANIIWVAVVGAIVSIIFSIIMQKFFQDRLVIQLHMWISSCCCKRRKDNDNQVNESNNNTVNTTSLEV